MVNQPTKFQLQTAEFSKPLRDLLTSKSHWLWSEAQKQAFAALKKTLSSTPTLAHYNANRLTELSSNASSYGLRVVLLQPKDDGEWCPVAYASPAMSSTEQWYAHLG